MVTPTDHLERRLFQVETLYEIGCECTRARPAAEVLVEPDPDKLAHDRI